MMAAEMVQLSGKVMGETGDLNLSQEIQDAEITIQIAFYELRIKHFKFVLSSIKSITSSCGTGVSKS